MKTTSERYRDLRDRCAAPGLRITIPQRDVLLRVLSDTHGHPTADELLNRVREVIPPVSHATVCRNVQELVGAGLVGTLQRGGDAARFEVDPDEHHHFVCGRCGRVWDVDRREVQLRGACLECRR